DGVRRGAGGDDEIGQRVRGGDVELAASTDGAAVDLRVVHRVERAGAVGVGAAEARKRAPEGHRGRGGRKRVRARVGVGGQVNSRVDGATTGQRSGGRVVESQRYPA